MRFLAELTLAMVLFTDAANADLGVVRRNLGLPERLLGVGLPLTILLGFLFAAIVFPSLDILDMALLAATLVPTDAALGKPVVANQAVPAVMREGRFSTRLRLPKRVTARPPRRSPSTSRARHRRQAAPRCRRRSPPRRTPCRARRGR